jgi:hypothetical protein
MNGAKGLPPIAQIRSSKIPNLPYRRQILERSTARIFLSMP